MQLMLNLEKESIQDLEKAIKILTKVKENKEQNKPITDGLDQITNVPQPQQQQASSMSQAAKSAMEQEKLMEKVDLSKIFGG